jgi:pimeloyl-ACP methyl ester carboxylesterase
VTIRRGYSDGPSGQIHWRMTPSVGPRIHGDLWCLHPAPFSSLAFTIIMPHLAKGRRVFAPDLPGYGGSDSLKEIPSIAVYAKAIGAIVTDHPIDLLGFHSGSLVAAEIAVQRGDLVRKTVLIDVPYFTGDAQAEMLAESCGPQAITAGLECLAPVWERGITRRIASQTLSRCFEMFVENLRAGAQMNDAFVAAFSYSCEARFGELKSPVMIMASKSMMLEPTRAAAAVIRGAQLIERLDITRAVLDEAAETTAQEICNFLENE